MTETLETIDTVGTPDSHSAMPSAAAIASGASAPDYGPDPSAIPAGEGAHDAAPVTLAQTAKAIGLPDDLIDSARPWLTGELPHDEYQLAELDTAHKAETREELRTLWGNDTDRNLASIRKYLQSLPGIAGEMFLSARDASGRALGNMPENLVRLLGAAQARGGLDLTKGDTGTKIRAIERFMRDNRTAYTKDEALQAKYRELLTQQQSA